MTKEMIEMLENVPFAILATSTPDGNPNAVPIGAKKVLDDGTILLSEPVF
jgi:predicted pyridoxine 5'-phosphate oxidase superfamily flavin-nucleotide-binding protein